MRQAPPVGVTCSGRGAWRVAQALLAAAAAGAFAAWALLHAQLPAWPALPLGLLAAGWAWWGTSPRAIQLHWDGQAWLADDTAGEAELMLDLGGWLLLRWRGAGRTRWLAVGAAEAGAAWHPLRAAVHALPSAPPATR